MLGDRGAGTGTGIGSEKEQETKKNGSNVKIVICNKSLIL
jgi:hypothetical protein